MSQYFARRLTRRALEDTLRGLQISYGVYPVNLSDGQVVYGPESVPILRSIDLGEPQIFCLLHRSIFNETQNAQIV